MRRPRLLISLLIVANVLVDAFLFGISVGRDLLIALDSYGVPVYTSPIFGQVGLLSLWLCLGRTPAPLSMVAATTTAVGLTWFSSLGAWMLLLLMPMMMVILVSGLTARWLGLRVWNVVDFEEPPPLPHGPLRLQFSILQLLSWTTATAVVLGILKSAGGPYWWNDVNTVNAADEIAYGAIAWMAVWTTLSQGRPVLRLVVALAAFVVFAGGAAVVTFSLAGFPMSHLNLYLRERLLHFAASTVLMLASLYVMRMAGYRVAFRRRRGVPEAEVAVETS